MKHNVFEQNAFDSNADVAEERQGQAQVNLFADFLVKQGLYKSIDITQTNYHQLVDLLNGKVNISIYCPACKEPRVFSMQAILAPYSINGAPSRAKLGDLICWEHDSQNRPNEAALSHSSSGRAQGWSFSGVQSQSSTRIITFPFQCAMNSAHRLDYIVRINGNVMTKIGQYPTIADLTFPELDEFKTVINKTSRKELGTAIGLYANGVGVGSYVYLRRIFERILDNAKTEAEQAGTVDLSGYNNMKVVERIRLLKDYLPAMINDNHVFYGIVSKGIHGLSEDECISYFPVLKEAIFMILRQWAQKKQEQEAAKRLRASLSQIASQVNS